jgi:hypothetical protein
LPCVLLLVVRGRAPARPRPDCERIAGVRPGLCPIPVDRSAGRRLPDGEACLTTSGIDGDAELSLADPGPRRRRELLGVVVRSLPGRAARSQRGVRLLPADEVAFLGVNIEDSEANALAHLREFDVPYPSVYDPANVYASRFRGVGPRTIPSTIFVDAEGRVAARVFGVIGTGELVGLADAIASRGLAGWLRRSRPIIFDGNVLLAGRDRVRRRPRVVRLAVRAAAGARATCRT